MNDIGGEHEVNISSRRSSLWVRGDMRDSTVSRQSSIEYWELHSAWQQPKHCRIKSWNTYRLSGRAISSDRKMVAAYWRTREKKEFSERHKQVGNDSATTTSVVVHIIKENINFIVYFLCVLGTSSTDSMTGWQPGPVSTSTPHISTRRTTECVYDCYEANKFYTNKTSLHNSTLKTETKKRKQQVKNVSAKSLATIYTFIGVFRVRCVAGKHIHTQATIVRTFTFCETIQHRTTHTTKMSGIHSAKMFCGQVVITFHFSLSYEFHDLFFAFCPCALLRSPISLDRRAFRFLFGVFCARLCGLWINTM